MNDDPRTEHEDVDVGTALRSYLDVLRRNLPLILLLALVAAGTAALYGSRQETTYEAHAEVLLTQQVVIVATAVTGVSDTAQFTSDPGRITQTQARVARTPELIDRVLQKEQPKGLDRDDFLADSDVEGRADADLLEFTVTSSRDDELATRLVNAYASEFTRFTAELQAESLAQARQDVERRLAGLADEPGGTASRQYTTLSVKADELRVLEKLQKAAAVVINADDSTDEIRPSTFSYVFLGLLAGLVLGCAAAFIREVVGGRVRKAEDVAESLRLPLLARLPDLAGDGPPAVLAEPNGSAADAVHSLRAAVESAAGDRARILVTSPGQAEGASAVTANLAAAMARTGRRVIVVDGDLRRPVLHKIFDMPREPGFSEVVAGRVSAEDALADVDLGSAAATGTSLQLLAAGAPAVQPGELLGGATIGPLLEQLASLCDVVLVDSPPLLRVGDALSLSGSVDGLLVVTSLKTVSRSALDELDHALRTSPARPLGVAVVCPGAQAGGTRYEEPGAQLISA